MDDKEIDKIVDMLNSLSKEEQLNIFRILCEREEERNKNNGRSNI